MQLALGRVEHAAGVGVGVGVAHVQQGNGGGSWHTCTSPAAHSGFSKQAPHTSAGQPMLIVGHGTHSSAQ